MAVTLKQGFLQILKKITYRVLFILFIYFKNTHANAAGDLYPVSHIELRHL